MPWHILQSLLRRLRKDGLVRVRFTGGDPFVYRRFREACELAAELGLEVSFVTNGQILAGWSRTAVKALRSSKALVSFYGADAAAHDRRCGVTGAFRRAVAAVRKLGESGTSVGVYLLVPRSSLGSVESFFDDIYQAGVKRIRMLQVFPQGRAVSLSGPEQLTDTDLRRLAKSVVQAKQRLQGISIAMNVLGHQVGLLLDEGAKLPAKLGCRLNLDSEWTVDAAGGVHPCCLFLGSERSPPFTVEDDEVWREYRLWTEDRCAEWVSEGSATSSSQLTSCPALGEPFGAGAKFVCPLTYAEW